MTQLEKSTSQELQSEILNELYQIRTQLAADLKNLGNGGGAAAGDTQTLSELYQIRQDLSVMIEKNQLALTKTKKQEYRIGIMKRNMMQLFEVKNDIT